MAASRKPSRTGWLPILSSFWSSVGWCTMWLKPKGRCLLFILSASTSIELLRAIGSFVSSCLFSPGLGCSVLFVLSAIPTVPHIIFCCSLFVCSGLFSAVPSLSVLDYFLLFPVCLFWTAAVCCFAARGSIVRCRGADSNHPMPQSSASEEEEEEVYNCTTVRPEKILRIMSSKRWPACPSLKTPKAKLGISWDGISYTQTHSTTHYRNLL